MNHNPSSHIKLTCQHLNTTSGLWCYPAHNTKGRGTCNSTSFTIAGASRLIGPAASKERAADKTLSNEPKVSAKDVIDSSVFACSEATGWLVGWLVKVLTDEIPWTNIEVTKRTNSNSNTKDKWWTFRLSGELGKKILQAEEHRGISIFIGVFLLFMQHQRLQIGDNLSENIQHFLALLGLTDEVVWCSEWEWMNERTNESILDDKQSRHSLTDLLIFGASQSWLFTNSMQKIA